MRRPKLSYHVGSFLKIWTGTLLAVLLAGGGCSGGCSSVFQPLPAPLPAAQTIEGGVQVRVTKSGLRTLTAAAKEIIENLTAGGICIPQPSSVDLGFLGDLHICHTRQCGGSANACKVNLALGNVATSVVSSSTLRADVSFSGSATVPLLYENALFDIPCNLGVSLSGAHLVVDVRVTTEPSTGELGVHLAGIRALDISPQFNICDLGLPSDVVSFITDIILDLVGTDLGLLLVNLVTPYIDDFIQGLLPRPLGIEGVVDVGSLLASIAPGIQSKVEVRSVPGGYAALPAEGVSVGVIVGLNADRDPSTRSPATASEPVDCVPQWNPPDLSMPPSSLGKAPGRQTYSLSPSGAFMGVPDPATDVAIGVSQTLLDLAGHHVAASGALCVGIGSAQIKQLNLGTVGILVRSLAELGRGQEPVLMVMRPTAPISFDIGDGQATSPYLTAHLRDLEIDFYALLFERYVRAFTIGVSVDAGVNLEFMIDADRQPVLVPTLVGLDASKIQVQVTNAQLLRETPEQLEKVFPTLLNLFLPALTSGLPPFPVPSIEGFTLGDLRLAKVTTSEDDFLAIYASLARAQGKPLPVERVITSARVARVSVPAPDAIHDGALPEIELDLGGDAPGGEPLEWQWRLGGGMWRPFDDDPRPVIRDLALAVQGHYTVEVRARVAGRYDTTDLDAVALPVTIDSAAPRVFGADARRDGDEIVVPVVDAVWARDEVELALGRPDDDAPATAWAATEGRLAIAELEGLADAAGRVALFARDPSGNQARAVLELGRVLAFHGQQMPSEGCDCRVGGRGSPRPGAALLLVAGAFLLAGRRLRRHVPWLLVVAAVALAAGCASSQLGSVECVADSECASMCPAGQVGMCDGSGACKCLDDIPIGWIGQYSDVAVDADGSAWISAYNSEHGDLMVARHAGSGRVPDTAWTFVDGVPPGPVVNAATDVRGGVRDGGDDVGLYTSIALGASGEPIVAYQDRTHASLKLAIRSGGAWRTLVVDPGVPDLEEIGRYTAITVDAAGRPGIAYLAIVNDGGTARSEVRFAQAESASPASSADFTQLVIESQAAPPDPSEGMLDDIPYVSGVFIAAARTPAGDPVVAWYDRVDGSLELAEWNPTGGAFKAPVVVDGAGAAADVGWYPSVAVAPDGRIHLSYVDATADDLRALVWPDGVPEIVDDGLRTDGVTPGGLPRPVHHFVGDNSAYVVAGAMRGVAYQDATAHELRFALRGATTWTHDRIAGPETPYNGSYGFYAAAAVTPGGEVVMTTFVVNQTTRERWVEVFRR